MKRQALAWFFVSLTVLWHPLASQGAERLRIVEERGYSRPGDNGPSEKVIANLTGATAAQRALIAKLWAEHSAAFPPEHRSYAIPDAGGIRVEWEHDGQTLRLFSCHTLFEDNPKAVATTRGVEALEGRARAEVMRAQPQWWQRFCHAFEKVVAEARDFHEPAAS